MDAFRNRPRRHRHGCATNLSYPDGLSGPPSAAHAEVETDIEVQRHKPRPNGLPPTPRRRFLQAIGATVGGLATAWSSLKTLFSRQARAAPLPPPLAEFTGSLLVRMQKDLETSLASGRTPSWVMVVDTRKCVGCNACTVACRAENPQGPAGSFRRVVELNFTPGLRPMSIYKPFNCLQCDNPPCAKAVPAGMVREPADAIVEFDRTQLRGPYAHAVARAWPWESIHVDDGRTFTQSTPVPQALRGARVGRVRDKLCSPPPSQAVGGRGAQVPLLCPLTPGWSAASVCEHVCGRGHVVR